MAHIINLSVQTLLSYLHIQVSADTKGLGDSTKDTSNKDKTYSILFWKVRQIITTIRASNLLWESFESQTLAAKLPVLRLIIDMRVR